MTLRRQRRSWDEIAAVDPHWAVLSEPGLRNGGWERGTAADEFRISGEREVEHVLAVAAAKGAPAERDAALDFGCGLGRLTAPLSERFGACTGVDISTEMVQRSSVLHAGRTNCTFRVNADPDLRVFATESFDLVLAELVLQHMPSNKIALGYVREFLRVLKPGGVAIFQIPAAVPRRNRLRIRPQAYHALRALGVPKAFLYERLGLHPITMAVAVPSNEIESLARESGCSVITIEDGTTPGGPSTPRYYVQREERRSAP